MSAGCCATPRPDCMGMCVEGIGNRCQALDELAPVVGGGAAGVGPDALNKPGQNEGDISGKPLVLHELVERFDEGVGARGGVEIALIKCRLQREAERLAASLQGLEIAFVKVVIGHVALRKPVSFEIHTVAGTSEGTASAQRILRTVPLKTCAGSGCNYPEGDCLGVCS